MKAFLKYLSITCFVLVGILGLKIIPGTIRNTLGFAEMLLSPILGLAFILGCVIPFEQKLIAIHKNCVGLVICFSLITVIGLPFCLLNWVQNSPKVILTAEYFDEHGYTLNLRENGTYKLTYRNMLATNVDYGKFKIESNKLFLINNEYGFVNPLLVKSDRIEFTQYNIVNDRQLGAFEIEHNELSIWHK